MMQNVTYCPRCGKAKCISFFNVGANAAAAAGQYFYWLQPTTGTASQWVWPIASVNAAAAAQPASVPTFEMCICQ